MKILFATMQFGRGYSQGTERYLSLLSAALRARGHETIFLAGDPEHRGPAAKLGELIQESPNVLACPSHGWMTVRGTPAGSYARLLADLKPDLVHVANPGHIGVGILEGATQASIPTVVSVVDFWWLCPKHTMHHYQGGICKGEVSASQCLHCIAASHESGMLRAIANVPLVRAVALPTLMFGRSLARGLPVAEIGLWQRRREATLAAMSRANAVIFLSKTARALLEPRLSGPRLHQIQNGLEARWFAPSSIGERAKPTKSDSLVIGYAGALAPHKGVHTLLEAVSLLGWSRTTVRIAAAAESSAYSATLRKLAAGLHVDFVGRVAADAMPDFLDQLDVLVVPSMWPENVPMAVLEAFARRKTVIASRMPGIAELFADASLLFEPGSARGLSDCLRRWLGRVDSPEMPRARTADEMVADTFRVYDEICRA